MSDKGIFIRLSDQYLKLTILAYYHMTNIWAQNELTSIVSKQESIHPDQKSALLEHYKHLAQSYTKIDQSVAVLSNFEDNCSYIFAGSFGSVFDIESESSFIDSVFEDQIFNKIHRDDLVERHVLELRYFQFLMTLPPPERSKYNTSSNIRVRKKDEEYMYIAHKTFYLTELSDGIIWLALCIYSPSSDQSFKQGIDAKIINNETGTILPISSYQQYDKLLLTSRELEVLQQIALGKSSKEIADKLCISTYTIHRHRQNIIHKMKVTNSTEAVKTALMMGLITS